MNIEEFGNARRSLSVERMSKVDNIQDVHVHRSRANILKGMAVDKVGCGRREGCRITRGSRPLKPQGPLAPGTRHPMMEREANKRLHLDEKSIFTAVRIVPHISYTLHLMTLGYRKSVQVPEGKV